MISVYWASYPAPPLAVTLDIDVTCDAVHGYQQLAFWSEHHGERFFMPIHVYDTATGRPVAMLLRTGKTPSGLKSPATSGAWRVISAGTGPNRTSPSVVTDGVVAALPRRHRNVP